MDLTLAEVLFMSTCQVLEKKMGVNLNEKGEQGHIMIYWTPIGCNRSYSIKHDLIQSAIFYQRMVCTKIKRSMLASPNDNVAAL